MNDNHIRTHGFSNPASESLYQQRWPDDPASREQYESGRECGGCSFYAVFNSGFGLCCHPKSRHHLETVLEHFTCPSYDEGWGRRAGEYNRSWWWRRSWRAVFGRRFRPRQHSKDHYQRAKRGWADSDVWNLDAYICQLMIPALERLKRTGHGTKIPDHAVVDEKGRATEQEHKRWERLRHQRLDQMIAGFKAAQEVTNNIYSHYDDEEWFETRERIRLRGFALFTEHFTSCGIDLRGGAFVTGGGIEKCWRPPDGASYERPLCQRSLAARVRPASG